MIIPYPSAIVYSNPCKQASSYANTMQSYGRQSAVWTEGSSYTWCIKLVYKKIRSKFLVGSLLECGWPVEEHSYFMKNKHKVSNTCLLMTLKAKTNTIEAEPRPNSSDNNERGYSTAGWFTYSRLYGKALKLLNKK